MKSESGWGPVRAGVSSLAMAALAVGLGGAIGARLWAPASSEPRLSVTAVMAVTWSLTGAWLSTTLSILPLSGNARLWLPPLALLTAIGELLPRSSISLPLLLVSLLTLGFVAVGHRADWRSARNVAALVCGASVAASLAVSNG